MFQPDPDKPICSAKGCQAPAVWVLAWNNPKIHTPERRKTWLACDEHREHLSNFLGVRGFLKDVVAFADWTAAEHSGQAGQGEHAAHAGQTGQTREPGNADAPGEQTDAEQRRETRAE